MCHHTRRPPSFASWSANLASPRRATLDTGHRTLDVDGWFFDGWLDGRYDGWSVNYVDVSGGWIWDSGRNRSTASWRSSSFFSWPRSVSLRRYVVLSFPLHQPSFPAFKPTTPPPSLCNPPLHHPSYPPSLPRPALKAKSARVLIEFFFPLCRETRSSGSRRSTRSVGGGASSKRTGNDTFLYRVFRCFASFPSDVHSLHYQSRTPLDAMFAHRPLSSRSSAHFVSRPLRTA